MWQVDAGWWLFKEGHLDVFNHSPPPRPSTNSPLYFTKAEAEQLEQVQFKLRPSSTLTLSLSIGHHSRVMLGK